MHRQNALSAPWLVLGILIAVHGSARAQLLLSSETFDGGLGTMQASNCYWPLFSGTGAWAPGDGNNCVDSPDGNGFARFGISPGCAAYSDTDTESKLESPAVSIPSCRRLTSRFRYFLDFEEGPTRDRAQVRVERSHGGATTYHQVANNGWSFSSELGVCASTSNQLVVDGALIDDSLWHLEKIDLSHLLPADELSVAFVA